LDDLINKFVSKHKFIEKYFFSSCGIKLQNLDSRMAELIIDHFTQHKIPVLCIHDSFVITADRAEELKICMIESFHRVIAEKSFIGSYEVQIKETGLGVGQWAVINSDPNWKDVIHGFLKESYDYPEWHKELSEFKVAKVSDYYI
jgi:hypothetical protein